MSTAEVKQRQEMLENAKMGLRQYLARKINLPEMEALASWLKPETKIDEAVLDIWNKFSFLIKYFFISTSVLRLIRLFSANF